MGLTEDQREVLDDEPMCIGTVEDITGHEVTAWVIPSMTWMGRLRWTPKLERYFVGWSTMWWGWPRHSFDKAKAKAEKALRNVDRRRGRQERP